MGAQNTYSMNALQKIYGAMWMYVIQIHIDFNSLVLLLLLSDRWLFPNSTEHITNY